MFGNQNIYLYVNNIVYVMFCKFVRTIFFSSCWHMPGAVVQSSYTFHIFFNEVRVRTYRTTDTTTVV